MEVNGLPLPSALVQIVLDAQGEWTAWASRVQADSYGNYFRGYNPEIYNLAAMAEVTAVLPERCPPASEELFELFAGDPGVIPYVSDFSRIIAFADLESGETFCLDYRGNEHDPEVILYEGAHWRRVAPNFAAFMELLERAAAGTGRKPEAVNGPSLPPVVNGLPLPEALVEVLRGTGGEWRQWKFKERVNAYGDPLDADFEMADVNHMIEETASLPEWLGPYAYDELEPVDTIPIPDFIPDVKDFSKLVMFGNTGSGEPLCLDYRDSLQEPKVIFRQDGYWRRVAPDFAAFWAMLEPDP